MWYIHAKQDYRQFLILSSSSVKIILIYEFCIRVDFASYGLIKIKKSEVHLIIKNIFDQKYFYDKMDLKFF